MTWIILSISLYCYNQATYKIYIVIIKDLVFRCSALDACQNIKKTFLLKFYNNILLCRLSDENGLPEIKNLKIK